MKKMDRCIIISSTHKTKCTHASQLLSDVHLCDINSSTHRKFACMRRIAVGLELVRDLQEKKGRDERGKNLI